MFLTVKQIKEDIETGADILAYISDRGGRKSSVIQELMIEEALKGNPSILLRDKADVIISENWLSEYILEKYKDYKFTSEKINNHMQAIYVDDRINDKKLLCYGLFLSMSRKYKSSYYVGFEKVKYIIWEEAVPEERLNQMIKYIKQSKMNEMHAVMSITSTVCRTHKAQIIMLGNDISYNILNPLTVTLNVIERLSKDCCIQDKCEIQNREYKYLFRYFDFKGSKNHWLKNDDEDIDASVKVKDDDAKLPYVVLSEFNKYYFYIKDKYIYCTNYKTKSKNIYFENEWDFFAHYSASHLLDHHKLEIALMMLNQWYGASQEDIARYFGDDWFCQENVEFQMPESNSSNALVNVFELNKMNYSQIMVQKNFNEILSIKKLLDENRIIYSNVKIKYDLELLRDKLIFAM